MTQTGVNLKSYNKFEVIPLHTHFVSSLHPRSSVVITSLLVHMDLPTTWPAT